MKTISEIKDKYGINVMHIIYAWFLSFLFVQRYVCNVWLSNKLGWLFNSLQNSLENSSYFNLFTTVIVIILGIILCIYIYKSQFSIFRIITFLFIILEAFCNKGWLEVTSFISFLSYQSLISLICLFCFIAELISLRRFWKATRTTFISDDGAVSSFRFDVPTDEDKLKRKHYAQVLVDKIMKTKWDDNNNVSLNILINEEYGYGKTSFLNFIKNEINSKKGSWSPIIVDFRPWLCDSPEQLSKEFFRVLRDKLSKYNLIANNLLIRYVKSLNEIDNDLISWIRPFTSKSIWESNNDIKELMHKLPVPVIVFIDDVDRLGQNEMNSLFRLLRNSADFPNMVNIVAADKSFLKKQLRNADITNSDDYLKKFFNYEMVLPANDRSIINIIYKGVRDILEQTNCQNIDGAIDSISKIKYFEKSFKNIRDWYRYQNIVMFNYDVLRTNNLRNDIYDADVFAISIIQFLRPDIYKRLRDEDNDLLVISNDNDKVYVLNKTVRELTERINPKSFTKQHLDILGKSNDEKIKIEDKRKKNDENTIHVINDFINREDISSEIIVDEILSNLFPSVVNPTIRNRVNFCDSFYKYFSGTIKSSQLSNREAIYLFTKTDDELFESELDKLILEKDDEHLLDKRESIRHKINYILENVDKYQCSRLHYVKRFFSFIEISAIKRPGNGTYSEKIEFEYNFLHAVYMFANLYYTYDETEILGSNESLELATYLVNNKKYALDLLFIGSFVNYSFQYVLINRDFAKKVVDMIWLDIEKDYLEKDPFSDETLALCKIGVEKCYSIGFTDHLWEYIIIQNNYIEWFIHCFKPDERKQGFTKDRAFIEAIGLKYQRGYNAFVDKIIEKHVKDEALIKDFIDLVFSTHPESQSVSDHIFLQYMVNRLNSDASSTSNRDINSSTINEITLSDVANDENAELIDESSIDEAPLSE